MLASHASHTTPAGDVRRQPYQARRRRWIFAYSRIRDRSDRSQVHPRRCESHWATANPQPWAVNSIRDSHCAPIQAPSARSLCVVSLLCNVCLGRGKVSSSPWKHCSGHCVLGWTARFGDIVCVCVCVYVLGGFCNRGPVLNSLMMSLHVNLFVIQSFSSSAFEGFGVTPWVLEWKIKEGEYSGSLSGGERVM